LNYKSLLSQRNFRVAQSRRKRKIKQEILEFFSSRDDTSPRSRRSDFSKVVVPIAAFR